MSREAKINFILFIIVIILALTKKNCAKNDNYIKIQ